MDLTQMIISQLGVQENQAKGGAGLLLKLAQDQLGHADFSKIAQYIPQVQQLISSAPKQDSVMAAVGGLAHMLGGKAEGLSNLASLATSFSKLGLKADMVGKFAPIIISYVQSKGGAEIIHLLEGIFHKK